MATGGVSENIAIGELAQTPPPSDYDGEESFVVLGRSPTSFTFNENASMMLQDALKSLGDEPVNLTSSHTESVIEKKEEVADVAENDKEIAPTAEKDSGSIANLTLEEVQAKVDKMLLENLELKETINQSNMAMKKQCETILQWQEDVQRVHDSHKAKFEETKQYIEKLQMENIKLKEELERAQQREKVLEEQKRRSSLVDKSSFENVQQFQLEAAQKKIDDLELVLKKKMEELELSEKKLEALKAVNQKNIAESELIKAALGKENKELKETVADLSVALDGERSMVAQLKSDLEKQTQNILDLQNSLPQSRSRSGSAPPDEQLENVRQQLMNAQMHITGLELTKSKYQQIINDKELEIKRLEQQFADTMAEKDDVHTALRAQLDLYKADYEAEASAKESVLAEKNQLAADLQSLHRRNQQLIEEVERLRNDGDFVHVRSRRATGTTDPTTDAAFVCPKCTFKFATYQALENHVYRCIELDALP